MKNSFSYSFFGILFLSCILINSSCKKDSFITSSDAFLRLSEDTLHFDTVFTTLGSTTQYLKIFNLNDQKLKLSSIELMGGASSFFKINVDGVSGTSFTNIDLEKNDSVYMFATVRIDPNVANLPFLVRDSIKILYNGNTKWIQLQAYGKNARFLKNVTVTTDSAFTKDLPIVILGSLTVNANKTLTIPKGTNIYIHPNAPIIINGTLKAIGDTATNNKIIFQGLRIDDPYKNYPGSWPYIYFSATSKDNQLQHCILKNAYQGIVAESPATNSNPKVTLDQCILNNIYDKAILCSNSSVTARNCLVSNCGFGLYLVSGGNYNINHCTFTSISNYFLSHKASLITLSNTNNDLSFSNPLNLTLNNSIIYGEGGFVENEIIIPKINTGTGFNVVMNSNLYNQKTDPSNITFSNSIKNTNPLFVQVDINNNAYNFRLQSNSPCINTAKAPSLNIDLDGKPRPVGTISDIGCYEKQ